MMVFSVINLLVGALGVVAIAANSVAGNLNWFTFVFPMALGSAASIRVVITWALATMRVQGLWQN